MGDGIRFRFDFSLVGESNLRGGDGIAAPDFRKMMALVDDAVETLASRHQRGEIGFPDLPFLVKEARAISGDAAAAMRKALGFEAEGREMYRRMAEGAGHPQEKKFFRLLSAEEGKHFEVIYEYVDFLEATGLRMGE